MDPSINGFPTTGEKTSGATMMIAIAGKGGVGKTTVAALLLRALALAGIRPLLAVDADPNANLHLLLGFPPPPPLGTLREEVRAAQGGDITAGTILETLVHQRVAEGKDIDLITMGRGEGPGCYCYVNNLLRQSLGRLAGSYRGVVVDNEAGMEHLSRRNLRHIHHLLLVADPSPRGLAAAVTIGDLARQLALPVGRTWLVLNRPYTARDRAGSLPPGLTVLAEIPHDPLLPEWEASGQAVLDIPATSPAASILQVAAGKLIPSVGIQGV